jgi:hypothetical protein
MEFVKSTDLVVLEESLLSNEIVAGNFVFSKQFINVRPENAYGVVLRTNIKGMHFAIPLVGTYIYILYVH